MNGLNRKTGTYEYIVERRLFEITDDVIECWLNF